MIGQNAVNGGNANGVEKKSYEPLTPGLYSVVLDRLTEKSTKKGDGAYLDASFKVIEGENKDRLIFTKFMIDHPNPKVVEIGKEQLNKFLKSVGVSGGLASLNFDTSEDTISAYKNKLLSVQIGIEEGSNGYGDRNKITAFATR